MWAELPGIDIYYLRNWALEDGWKNDSFVVRQFYMHRSSQSLIQQILVEHLECASYYSVVIGDE